MVERYISPIAKDVCLQFECPYCGKIQYSNILDIPHPKYDAKDVARSFSFRKYVIQCKNNKCQQTIEINISNSVMGGSIEIDDLNEDEVISLTIR